MVCKDWMVAQVPKAILDPKDREDCLDYREHQEALGVEKEWQDLLGQWEHQDILAHLERQVKMDYLVSLALEVHPVLLEAQVYRGCQEGKVLLAPKAERVTVAYQGSRDRKEILDFLDFQDQKESRVAEAVLDSRCRDPKEWMVLPD